jgi:UMF1 family MFS transporter
MDICGKGASFLGTTLVAFVSQVTAGIEVHIFGITLQNENLAVGSLIILFIVGYMVFCKADELNKSRT